MKISDLIAFSFSSLLKRKFRTFLTVLGVIIGTISIVVMISIGFGMKASIMESMNSFGDMRMIEVNFNNYGSNNDDKDKKFLDDKLVAELGTIEHVENVMPVLNYNPIIKYGKYMNSGSVIGISRENFDKLGLQFKEGGIPTSNTELQFVYGNMIITSFYDTKNYVNPYYENGELVDVDLMSDSMTVYLNSDKYFQQGASDENGNTITPPKKYHINAAGVLKGKISEWNEHSYNIYCDIDVLKNYLKKEFKNEPIPGQPTTKSGKPYKEIYYSTIRVYVDEIENVSLVQQTINEMGYQTYAEAQWIESEMSTMNIIQMVLGGIGAVSLFVAAIGITNTMSMSIYERTKEIGIMKVIGCRIKDIQAMFLIEAGFIGFIGGIIGVGISYLLSYLMNHFLAGTMEEMGMSTLSIIPLWLCFAAIIFAVVIGMVAGFFPSVRAMKLSPLTAIKNE